MPSIPHAEVFPPDIPEYYSRAGHRAPGSHATQRAYPWLLTASTLIAVTFCYLYISKPVILEPGSSLEPGAAVTLATNSTTSKGLPLLPAANHLPGDSATTESAAATDPRSALPALSPNTPFEETNLRIQHVLTAETPDGGLSRIVLDVPVLYPSRELRWTPSEVAEARDLLQRLEDHRTKTRQLRDEGDLLLASWNDLVERSIPANDLRADSPSLPENEAGQATPPRAPGLDSTDAVQLQQIGQ
jgi:hypothetical protein